MKIKYDVTIEDLIAFNQSYLNHSPTMRYAFVRNRILGSLIVFVTPLLLLRILPASSGFGYFVIIAALFAGVANYLTYPSQTRRRVRKIVSKLYREGENKGTIGPQELEATQEGLICRTPYHENRTSWAMLEKIESTPDYTFLYVGSNLAHVICHDKVAGDFRAFMRKVGKYYHPDKKFTDSTNADALLR